MSGFVGGPWNPKYRVPKHYQVSLNGSWSKGGHLAIGKDFQYVDSLGLPTALFALMGALARAAKSSTRPTAEYQNSAQLALLLSSNADVGGSQPDCIPGYVLRFRNEFSTWLGTIPKSKIPQKDRSALLDLLETDLQLGYRLSIDPDSLFLNIADE